MAPIVVVALGLYLYFATIGVHGPAIPIVLGACFDCVSVRDCNLHGGNAER